MIKCAVFMPLFCLQAFVMGAEQNSTENIKDPFIFEVYDMKPAYPVYQEPHVLIKQGTNNGMQVGIRFNDFPEAIDITFIDKDTNSFYGFYLKTYMELGESFIIGIAKEDIHSNNYGNSIFKEIVKPILQDNIIPTIENFVVKQENAYKIEEYKTLQKRIEAMYHALSVKLLRTKIIKNMVMDIFFTDIPNDTRTEIINNCDDHIKALQYELVKISSQESMFSAEQELACSDFLNVKLTVEKVRDIFRGITNSEKI